MTMMRPGLGLAQHLLPEPIARLFRHDGDEWRRAWDYEFKWTPDHRDAGELRPMMYTYDTLGEEALNRLDEISSRSAKEQGERVDEDDGGDEMQEEEPPEAGGTVPTEGVEGMESEQKENDQKRQKSRPDLYSLLQENAETDEAIGRLWEETNSVPAWVDWDQIERGQNTFMRYAGPAIFALTFQSLVGGMGSRRVVETLARTGGFSVKTTRRRLLETFQHILQSTESLASIQPGGAGHAATLRVRRRITTLASRRPGYYDTETNGIPINDLDSAGTISTFSATLLWIGLPRQGIFLSKREQNDYLALWRYIAHVIGAPTEPFASLDVAKAFMESLLLSELDPSDTSRALAGNVLTGMAEQPPTYVSRPFLAAETYWLNGSTLSRALAIERPPAYYTLLVFGQCLFFMYFCYSSRIFKGWDEKRIERIRRGLFNITIHKEELGALGEESMFDFQYVPMLDTVAEQLDVAEKDSKGGSRRKRTRGVSERRGLWSLAVAASVVGLGGWLCSRGVSAIVRRVFRS